jgi:hypothetical protein
MKRLSLVAVLGAGIVACTVKAAPTGAPSGAVAADSGVDPTTEDPGADAGRDPVPTTPDGCLDGQDMNADDVDITSCPPIPSAPADAIVNGKKVNLGAWEMGTTASGKTYQYGTLTAPGTSPRKLQYDGGEEAVNDENLKCWAKGYYRLRKILLAAPAEWVALKDAGFQYRFFQFQTDLRNGPTGYKTISSFEDHLVKWVTVVDKTGACQQPTLAKFKAYATSELKRRGLPVPP